MLIIVDGYNFIFTVPELERHVKASRIEPLRDYLASLLLKYKEKKHYDVLVVFDGNFTGASLPRKQTSLGVTVVYSKTGVSADTEIKTITTRCQNPKDIFVVTYDNDILRHVRKCGCHTIEPRALYKEILEIANETGKKTTDEPEGKRSGPSESDAKYWMDVFKDVPDADLKPAPKPTDFPMEKKKKKSRPRIDEPLYKYQGPSDDETQFWIRLFEGTEKDEPQD